MITYTESQLSVAGDTQLLSRLLVALGLESIACVHPRLWDTLTGVSHPMTDGRRDSGSSDLTSRPSRASGRHLEVNTGAGKFIITCLRHPSGEQGNLGFSLPQRKWANLSIGQDLACRPYKFADSQYVSSIVLEADFLQKPR